MLTVCFSILFLFISAVFPPFITTKMALIGASRIGCRNFTLRHFHALVFIYTGCFKSVRVHAVSAARLIAHCWVCNVLLVQNNDRRLARSTRWLHTDILGLRKESGVNFAHITLWLHCSPLGAGRAAVTETRLTINLCLLHTTFRGFSLYNHWQLRRKRRTPLCSHTWSSAQKAWLALAWWIFFFFLKGGSEWLEKVLNSGAVTHTHTHVRMTQLLSLKVMIKAQKFF